MVVSDQRQPAVNVSGVLSPPGEPASKAVLGTGT
jgi:hypothetical protein